MLIKSFFLKPNPKNLSFSMVQVYLYNPLNIKKISCSTKKL